MVEFEIHADDAGQRADRFLRKLLANAPLALIQRLLRKGDVRIDGRKAAGNDRLQPGDRVELRLADAQFAELRGQTATTAPARALPALDVLLEDPDLLLVDKPGGLAVHGGTGIGPDHLAARLAARLASTGPGGAATFRPAPAHRIDRGTSGIVAIGLSARGLRGLTAAFRERRAEKVYLAVVHGRPDPAEGTIELALEIADRGADRAKAVAVPAADDRGATARSRYRVRRSRGALSLVEVAIDTGRTHQIRAHLAAQGHPLVGDRRYGAPPRPALGPHRIALHAWRLAFPHPADARPVEVEAPWPADLAALLPDGGA